MVNSPKIYRDASCTSRFSTDYNWGHVGLVRPAAPLRSDSMVNFADWIGSRRRWLSLRRTAWRGAIYVLPLAGLVAAATSRVAAPHPLDPVSLICLDLSQRSPPRKPPCGTPKRT